ncbi:MAG: formate dehydrogenase accessory sulfurtransferase FdhD [Acetobacteraceae bacterium]|nr:formate dehydrogenase accessory sulfurtransferase FdhD [Acetobacteraceae bacterium]
MFALEATAAVPPPAQCVPRQAWRYGSASTGERILAEEVPVAFSYDGATHAVLMATPDDLEDFAIGFSYTEGIITTPDEITELAVVAVTDGIVLRMWLTGGRSDAFAARRRRFVGPAGCGMCGLESLAEANRSIPMTGCDLRVSRQDIAEAVAALPARQQLNMQTRAVHAAAFWEPGWGLVLREDVGRHNALDKLAGALLRAERSAARGVIVLSSRISIELVQKAGMMGASIIVGVSAPTAMAVRTAESIGLTLVGIARDDGFEVFTHPARITQYW